MAEGGQPLKDAGNAWEIYAANADGTRGERVATEYNDYKGSLEPGDYIVRATLGEASAEQAVKRPSSRSSCRSAASASRSPA